MDSPHQQAHPGLPPLANPTTALQTWLRAGGREWGSRGQRLAAWVVAVLGRAARACLRRSLMPSNPS